MTYLKTTQIGNPEDTKYALLIHSHYSDQQTLEHFYLDHISHDVVIFSVDYDKPKTVSANVAKAVARQCIEELTVRGVDTLFICDSRYFKAFTKQQTMTKTLGKVIPCSLDDSISIIGCPNYGSIEHDPTNEAKIQYGISTLRRHLELTEAEDIEFTIHKASEEEVPAWLNRLLTHPQITVDVETLSLKHYAANPQTIAFAWSTTESVVFRMYKKSVREQLKAFFEEYQGDIICHNAYFDLKVLIYTLWMEHLEDFRGLKKGIDTFKCKTYDTLVINKILLNSTSGPDLSLKALTIEYMGNYAEDVKDITKLSLDKLLTYNAKDAIATFWLFSTTYPKLQDKLLHFYNSLGIPSVFLCIRISLTGMPISISRVDQLHRHLSSASTALISRLRTYPEVIKATHLLQKRRWKKHCAKLKASIPNIANSYEPFNPNSGDQLCVLFYEILGFKIPHYTDEGNPSTDKKAVATLKELHPKYAYLFDTIQDIADISTILSTFIPAFKRYSKKTRSGYRLYGEFSSVGTQSYRLASNSPNLMNLPSGSKYGKAVKALFVAHKGKKFGGADFAALEAKIDAILTGDPNKEKVYTQGYDSHMLNTITYWPEEFEGKYRVAPDNVKAYIAKVGDTDIRFLSTDSIEYEGNTYSGEELYELLTN